MRFATDDSQRPPAHGPNCLCCGPRVSRFGAAWNTLADALQRHIAELDAADPGGVLIALTENWGGKLADAGRAGAAAPERDRWGSFVFPQLPPAVWSYRAGKAWLGDGAQAQASHGGLSTADAGAASGTADDRAYRQFRRSVVIAFSGRPNTRRFGTATRGLTTATMPSRCRMAPRSW